MAYMLVCYDGRQGTSYFDDMGEKKTQLTRRDRVSTTKEDIVERNEQFVEQPACSLGQRAAAII